MNPRSQGYKISCEASFSVGALLGLVIANVIIFWAGYPPQAVVDNLNGVAQKAAIPEAEREMRDPTLVPIPTPTPPPRFWVYSDPSKPDSSETGVFLDVSKHDITVQLRNGKVTIDGERGVITYSGDVDQDDAARAFWAALAAQMR